MRAIAANEGRYPISAQCRLLGVARSTYYSMRSRADRPDAPDPAAPAVVAAHAASKGRYGSRKIKASLERSGVTVSRRRVCRIMRENGLVSAYGRKRFKVHPGAVNEADVPNVVARGFGGRAPRTHICSDLTYVRVGASWNYVCLLVDLYNREIVGHSAGPRKDARLVKSAFATLSFPISDIEVFHTDRGSEFDNAEIDLMLEAFGIERSLSAKGCPYDNAVDESTVSATVKTTNFAIALQPIPPTQFPQSRQRIFTISTNAGAYASTDKRTMLSGGAAVAEKNLIGELDMYREAGIKPNFSDIAKRYGKDRHTVAAYWRAEGGRPRDGRADRAGSFDAHIEEVAAKAQLPGVTKKGIHEWLLHRYPGEDLAGYNAFTQFMRKNGIAVGASVGPEPHPRFETPPGLQLQFDWKESVRMANRDGELFEFNVFAATLGHSRRHIFIRSGTRTTDDLVRCMYATIARLGGVPREWVTDNMSALVTVKGGRRLKVQRAYEFAKAAGFELKLCRPRSPQTKGKVESSNRFLSRLAAYQGDFDGWDDIDEIIARIEDASNSEPNETTGLPPSALFMEEKDALLPVGNLRALEEAMGDVVRVARVPATMLVSAHGEPMSVPRRCIGRPARIVCMPGGAMDCYVGGELVATHVAGGPAYDPAHYAEAMAGKRWFGDAAGDIEAAAAANLGLLDSIGGSL